MNIPRKLTWPRRFEESSHQYHAEGTCHGLGLDKDGRPVAILEYDGGDVKIRRLDEHYFIKLGSEL